MPTVHYRYDAPPPELRPERFYVGPMSYAEYRALAGQPEMRLEYVEGVVYALATGTRGHARIASNVFRRLAEEAHAAGCRTFSMSLSVRTPRGNEYIPDMVVECDPPTTSDDHATDTPCVVVEVLSPSTASVDLGDKRAGYQLVPSLGAYLVVEAEWRAVHHYWRDAAGAWQQALLVGDGTVALPCPAGLALTLSEIYEGLDVPDVPPGPRIPHLRLVREPEPV